MRCDRLVLAEIVDAAERVIDLASVLSAEDHSGDRDRRDELL